MASLENKYGKSAVDATRNNALPPYLDLLFEQGVGGGAQVETHLVELAIVDWVNNTQVVTLTCGVTQMSDIVCMADNTDTNSTYSFGAYGIKLSNAEIVEEGETQNTVNFTFTAGTTPTEVVKAVLVVINSADSATEYLDELARAAIAAAEHYPTISNGIWQIWNVDAGTWESTGVSAIGPQGPKGDPGDSGNYYFRNKAVAATDWVADATYEDYPYKATVACADVTANDGVDLVYSIDDAASGSFAPIANTVADGVEIWAKEAVTLTIPTIIIHPPASGSIETPSVTWLDQVYPIGSTYVGTTSTNPAVLFGGTWEQIIYNNYGKYFFPAQTLASGASMSGTITITTHGGPVFCSLSGDFNPTTATTCWIFAKISRDGTQLMVECSQSQAASSRNQPFAISCLDTPTAGTHTYTGIITQQNAAAQYGETDPNSGGTPCLTVFEIGSLHGYYFWRRTA